MNGSTTCWVRVLGCVKETILNNAVLDGAEFYLTESEAWDAVAAVEEEEAVGLESQASAARERAKAASQKAALAHQHARLTGPLGV